MRPVTIVQRAIRAQFTALGFPTVHVPNGTVLAGDKAKRARQMNSLKADGLLVGFPDLLVYAPEGRIGHVEVKCEGSRQSPTQIACEAWLETLGHKYAVLRSHEDVRETLERWQWL